MWARFMDWIFPSRGEIRGLQVMLSALEQRVALLEAVVEAEEKAPPSRGQEWDVLG